MIKNILMLFTLGPLSVIAKITPAPMTEISLPNVKETFIDVDHGKLFCRVMGKGKPLIILHGGPGLSQNYLRPQMEKLSENNLVIFYDQRGSGESVGEINSENIRMSTFVEDLDSIRKAFGFKQVSILGHSFGGLLAMHYAIAHPKAIDKLILLNSAASSSDDFALFLKEWTKRMAPLMDQINQIQESSAFIEGNPDTIAHYFNLMFQTYCFEPKKAKNLSLKMSRKANIDGPKTYAILEDNYLSKPFDIQPDLRKLKCKTLIIHGDYDPAPLNTAINTHENIRKSKLIVMKDCGHFPFVEKPQELFEHLSAFLLN